MRSGPDHKSQKSTHLFSRIDITLNPNIDGNLARTTQVINFHLRPSETHPNFDDPSLVRSQKSIQLTLISGWSCVWFTWTIKVVDPTSYTPLVTTTVKERNIVPRRHKVAYFSKMKWLFLLLHKTNYYWYPHLVTGGEQSGTIMPHSTRMGEIICEHCQATIPVDPFLANNNCAILVKVLTKFLLCYDQ